VLEELLQSGFAEQRQLAATAKFVSGYLSLASSARACGRRDVLARTYRALHSPAGPVSGLVELASTLHAMLTDLTDPSLENDLAGLNEAVIARMFVTLIRRSTQVLGRPSVGASEPVQQFILARLYTAAAHLRKSLAHSVDALVDAEQVKRACNSLEIGPSMLFGWQMLRTLAAGLFSAAEAADPLLGCLDLGAPSQQQDRRAG
jgi:hypothetical protein